MNAYDYLNQITYINRQINFDLLELEELKERATSISSCNFGEKVSSSKSTEAPFVRVLEKIWEKQEKLTKELTDLETKKEEIVNTINQLTNADEKFILLYRYVQRMKWEDIQEELHLSQTTVFRFHRSALKKIIVPN